MARVVPLIVNTRKRLRLAAPASEVQTICRKLRRTFPGFRFERMPVGIPLSTGDTCPAGRGYEIDVYDKGTKLCLGRLSDLMRPYINL